MNNNIFDNNLPHLDNLFARTDISSKTPRLKEIFQSAEKGWQKNLDRLAGKKVQYILIAEAAPWSDVGTPRFFYNEIESRYHKRIWKAFFPDTPVPSESEKAFAMLADKGFLLIDSIPFSMRYKGKREHLSYYKIIANSIDWWMEKLRSEKITFAKQVKVAFAFKINAYQLIKATGGQLKLKDGQTIKLVEELIAADGSGFTSSKKLREIYSL